MKQQRLGAPRARRCVAASSTGVDRVPGASGKREPSTDWGSRTGGYNIALLPSDAQSFDV